MTTSFISVCIPAYNRVNVIGELLDSIITQDFNNYEIVICEDKSPQRDDIRNVVERYAEKFPNLIRYYENETNLGYDANLRNLINRAHGDYCFFMGNDDLMYPGALSTVSAALQSYDNLGVVLRTYASFDGTPDKINQIFRYFEQKLFFPAGAPTICTFYRRSVVIPGIVLHRKTAIKWSTDRFDGTLLYQLYLVANILVDMNGIFLPEILALYRNGGVPDFGNSEAEREKFVPTDQTPESSVCFVKGMLDIAAWVEKERQVPIFKQILEDIGNYSYPILSIQSSREFPIFLKYGYSLGRLGLWRNGMFFLYFSMILIIGAKNTDVLIRRVKKMLGYTPIIGAVYRGEHL